MRRIVAAALAALALAGLARAEDAKPRIAVGVQVSVGELELDPDALAKTVLAGLAEKLEKAGFACELGGAAPVASPTHFLQGRVRFGAEGWREKKDGLAGVLYVDAASARVIDLATNHAVTHVVFASAPGAREESELAFPELGLTGEPQPDKVTAFARAVGERLGNHVAQRLAPKAPPPPVAAKPPEKAPEKTPDKDKDVKKEFFELRFKNWNPDDLQKFVDAMRKREGVSDWREGGVSGPFAVHRCAYSGQFIIKLIRDTLEKEKLKAKVTKSGEAILIEKES